MSFSPTLAQEISISDYLDLIELAEDHETGISWYMGKLPLHTDVPEMFEDICNAPNSPWRDLGEVVFKRCYIICIYTYIVINKLNTYM